MNIVIVGHDGTIHDIAVWTEPLHVNEPRAEWANGRDINCMTCLVVLARRTLKAR